MLTIDSLSVEYIRIPVRWEVPGTGAVNPTGFPVSVAFRTSGAAVTWLPAVWDGIGEYAGLPWYMVRVLVGVDASNLNPGTYEVLVRVTATPQIPVRAAGPIKVL